MSLKLLEHVNLRVVSLAEARRFYVDGLRFAVNDVTSSDRVLHVNCGCSQIHLPSKVPVKNPKPVVKSDVLDGFVELLTKEDLHQLEHRLKAMKIGLKAPELIVTDEMNKPYGKYLRAWCPWGNEYRIYQATPDMCSILASLGTHPGGSDQMVGLVSVHLFCPEGSSSSISAFYEEVFGCEVTVEDRSCSVFFDFFPGQRLVFEESDACKVDVERHYHVAIYLKDKAQFSQAFLRAESLGVVYLNPSFEGGPVEFASSETLVEAQAAWQFRVKDFQFHPDGPVFFQLEHEVRSPQHKCFPISSISFL